MKLVLECLVCAGKIKITDTSERVDAMSKVWDKLHEPCRQTALANTTDPLKKPVLDGPRYLREGLPR